MVLNSCFMYIHNNWKCLLQMVISFTSRQNHYQWSSGTFPHQWCMHPHSEAKNPSIEDVINKHHKNRNLHTHKKIPPYRMSIENVVDKAIQSHLRRIIWKNTIEPCHSPAWPQHILSKICKKSMNMYCDKFWRINFKEWFEI